MKYHCISPAVCTELQTLEAERRQWTYNLEANHFIAKDINCLFGIANFRTILEKNQASYETIVGVQNTNKV